MVQGLGAEWESLHPVIDMVVGQSWPAADVGEVRAKATACRQHADLLVRGVAPDADMAGAASNTHVEGAAGDLAAAHVKPLTSTGGPGSLPHTAERLRTAADQLDNYADHIEYARGMYGLQAAALVVQLTRLAAVTPLCPEAALLRPSLITLARIGAQQIKRSVLRDIAVMVGTNAAVQGGMDVAVQTGQNIMRAANGEKLHWDPHLTGKALESGALTGAVFAGLHLGGARLGGTRLASSGVTPAELTPREKAALWLTGTTKTGQMFQGAAAGATVSTGMQLANGTFDLSSVLLAAGGGAVGGGLYSRGSREVTGSALGDRAGGRDELTEGPLTEGPLTEGPLTEGPLTEGLLAEGPGATGAKGRPAEIPESTTTGTRDRRDTTGNGYDPAAPPTAGRDPAVSSSVVRDGGVPVSEPVSGPVSAGHDAAVSSSVVRDGAVPVSGPVSGPVPAGHGPAAPTGAAHDATPHTYGPVVEAGDVSAGNGPAPPLTDRTGPLTGHLADVTGSHPSSGYSGGAPAAAQSGNRTETAQAAVPSGAQGSGSPPVHPGAPSIGDLLSGGPRAQPAPGSVPPGVVVTGPVVTGPVVTGPVVTGPVVTGPVVTGPVVTGPTGNGPVENGPMVTAPLVTGPVGAGPVPDVGGKPGTGQAAPGAVPRVMNGGDQRVSGDDERAYSATLTQAHRQVYGESWPTGRQTGDLLEGLAQTLGARPAGRLPSADLFRAAAVATFAHPAADTIHGSAVDGMARVVDWARRAGAWPPGEATFAEKFQQVAGDLLGEPPGPAVARDAAGMFTYAAQRHGPGHLDELLGTDDLGVPPPSPGRTGLAAAPSSGASPGEPDKHHSGDTAQSPAPTTPAMPMMPIMPMMPMMPMGAPPAVQAPPSRPSVKAARATPADRIPADRGPAHRGPAGQKDGPKSGESRRAVREDVPAPARHRPVKPPGGSRPAKASENRPGQDAAAPSPLLSLEERMARARERREQRRKRQKETP